MNELRGLDCPREEGRNTKRELTDRVILHTYAHSIIVVDAVDSSTSSTD